MREEACRLEDKYPKRLYFVIPSYFEMPEIVLKVFKSIMDECSSLPCEMISIIMSVGSQEEVNHINKFAIENYDLRNVKITFMIQKSGKRIAMGHALRAVSRDFNRVSQWDESNKDDLVVMMDGDAVLVSGILEKTLPLFKIKPNLGVVTPNNIALSIHPDSIFQIWYQLKFMQRNHTFQSHSLSKRILTTTGRFCVYRAPIVVDNEFIKFVETDHIDHWIFGRFRFLMGDDKSTWFYCLKEGYEMLYIPDAHVLSIEERSKGFFKTSISLMKRWYGNTLRNNKRAIMLGPKKMGFFIWWCLVDQRLTTWTPLVGLVSSIMLSIFISPYYFMFYMIWVLITRLLMSWVYVLQGMRLRVEHIIIMIYVQWVGSIVKLITMYNLKKQSWDKGESSDSIYEELHGIFPVFQKSIRHMMVGLNIFILFIFCGLSTHALSVPPLAFFKDFFTIQAAERPSSRVINAAEFGAVGNDSVADDVAINKAIRSVSSDAQTTLQLPSGRLILNAPIRVNKSNITIAGDKNSSTILDSHFSIKEGSSAIVVSGDKGASIGSLSVDAKKNDEVLLIDPRYKSESTYKNAEYIWIGTPNTKEFLDKIGSKEWNREYPWLRQTIVQSYSISKDAIKILKPLSFDMPEKAEIYAPNIIRGITIKDLSLTQAVPNMKTQQAKSQYRDLASKYAVNGISFEWAAHSAVENVTIDYAGRNPISLENSYSVNMKNLHIDGSWNKGKDGNGYVRFSRSYYCSIADSEIKDIRHLVFQWSSSHNTVEHCKIYVDVNFHGGFSHDNLVTGCTISPPDSHPWGRVTRMKKGGSHWAPADGEGNVVRR